MAPMMKALKANGYEPVLKDARWLLLKRPENLTDKQEPRLAEILQLMEEKVFWTVSELAERFQVSEETIRRDARQLERSGVVQKVHGGLSSTNNLIEAPYRIRLRENAESKQKIAQKAAGLVTEGMTLLLDSGTTCHWLARALAPVRNLTIVTNSVEIAHEVLGNPGLREELRRKGLERAKSYTPEKMAARFLEIVTGKAKG